MILNPNYRKILSLSSTGWTVNLSFLITAKLRLCWHWGTHQRLASVGNFTVKAKDTIMSRVYQFKYLGVVLDPCLSWNDHIDYTSRKCPQGLACYVRRVRSYHASHVSPCITPWYCRYSIIVQLSGTVAARLIGTTLINYKDVLLVLSKATEFHNHRSTTPSAGRHFSHVEII